FRAAWRPGGARLAFGALRTRPDAGCLPAVDLLGGRRVRCTRLRHKLQHRRDPGLHDDRPKRRPAQRISLVPNARMPADRACQPPVVRVGVLAGMADQRCVGATVTDATSAKGRDGMRLLRGVLLIGFAALIAKLFITGEMTRYMAPALDPLMAFTGVVVGAMG